MTPGGNVKKTSKRMRLLTVAVAAMFGVFGGLGFFTFGYGEGYAYLSNNPATCANCHVMQSHYDAWVKSSHHAVAILEAKAAGADDASLAKIFELQRKAMWRLDYVSSENSRGFHADQEAARILAESIDYSRQAQALALRYRAPAAPAIDKLPKEPVQGVTPSDEGLPPEPDERAAPASSDEV